MVKKYIVDVSKSFMKQISFLNRLFLKMVDHHCHFIMSSKVRNRSWYKKLSQTKNNKKKTIFRPPSLYGHLFDFCYLKNFNVLSNISTAVIGEASSRFQNLSQANKETVAELSHIHLNRNICIFIKQIDQ